jgi:hypothetical protein
MFKYHLFSHWIYIWFILCYIGLIDVSPIIFFIFALLFLIISIIITIIYHKKLNKRYISNFIIKLIPTILLFKTPLIVENDLIFGFFLLYIYIIVLLMNNNNPIDIYLKIYYKHIENC